MSSQLALEILSLSAGLSQFSNLQIVNLGQQNSLVALAPELIQFIGGCGACDNQLASLFSSNLNLNLLNLNLGQCNGCLQQRAYYPPIPFQPHHPLHLTLPFQIVTLLMVFGLNIVVDLQGLFVSGLNLGDNNNINNGSNNANETENANQDQNLNEEEQAKADEEAKKAEEEAAAKAGNETANANEGEGAANNETAVADGEAAANNTEGEGEDANADEEDAAVEEEGKKSKGNAKDEAPSSEGRKMKRGGIVQRSSGGKRVSGAGKMKVLGSVGFAGVLGVLVWGL
ncbi:hypothetical protein BKA64DRAFT_747420 [Cadophora sp. MPI-SDFR-AT-0126]|nr:hypothetical protein BKA64DRAFT_747420 [Leotiomycetes sp. MPI-SDFR-AT-0126]